MANMAKGTNYTFVTYLVGLVICSSTDSVVGHSKHAEVDPCGNVNIVSRDEWGARDPKAVEYLAEPATYSFIHHTAGSQCFNQDDCSEIVRGIQNYHMDGNGWSDIGYSFLIGEDGNAYEGRGWDRVGAHTKGYNDVGLAFSIMGDFSHFLPKTQALSVAQDMIACGVQLGKFKPNYILRGHQDMGSTACPGDTLYSEIQTWPHY